jgi:hypothetical protein
VLQGEMRRARCISTGMQRMSACYLSFMVLYISNAATTTAGLLNMVLMLRH